MQRWVAWCARGRHAPQHRVHSYQLTSRAYPSSLDLPWGSTTRRHPVARLPAARPCPSPLTPDSGGQQVGADTEELGDPLDRAGGVEDHGAVDRVVQPLGEVA